jgi:cytoskeletal protein RodZ
MADRPPTDEPPPLGDEGAHPPVDPVGSETEPTAWYRRPAGLVLWALSVLILIALIVYGIIELVGDQGTTSNPKTTTSTSPTPSTTSTTTTTTPPASSSTTTSAEPSTSTEAPEPQPTRQPAPQPQPTHRHHWPSWLPTTVPALP